MRIVFVQLFELPSPMAHAIQILHTACALAERGHRVVLHPRRSKAGADPADEAARTLGRELPEGLAIRAVPFRHKRLAGLDFRRRLAGYLRRDDGGTAFYARQRRQTLSALGLRRILRARTPIVYEFHNLEHVLARESGHQRRAAEIRAEEQRIAWEADALVAISRPLAEDLAQAFSVAAPTVIPDGVDLERFRGVAHSFEGEFHIVYAGSLYRHKAVENLVHMMRELPQCVALTLVGGHPLKEFQRLRSLVCADDSIASRIRFTGQRTPSEVARELARADLIVLPAADGSRSQRYTSPLKLFEAMGTGTPIVAAPSPALTSILRDGETAVIAASGSPGDLAAAVRRALDPALGRTLGGAARAAAEAYAWARRAERIEAILLTSGAAPAPT